MAMPVPTVALYGAINAVINVALAINVSRTRGATKTSMGNGEAPEMLRAIRAHANNAEYVPFAVLLLLIAELSGGASMPLHVFGGTLTVARLIQAHGMLANVVPTRAIGSVLTWLTMVGSAVYILVLRYGG